jgi:gliding motility-associated-like protein
MKQNFYSALLSIGISLSFTASPSVVSAASNLYTSNPGDENFSVEATLLDTSITTQPIASGTLCDNSTIVVLFSTSGVSFGLGNIFEVQLSDALGDYSSPTVIGTLSLEGVVNEANTYIYCQVPAGLPVGAGYRLRVVSSSPSIIGSDVGNLTIINLVAPPIPSVSVSGPKEFCFNSASTLLVSSAPVRNLWYPGAVSANNFLAVLSEGLYFTKVSGVNGCITSSIPEYIRVIPPIITYLGYFNADSSFQIAAGDFTNLTICEGDTARLGINIQGGQAPFDLSYTADGGATEITVFDVSATSPVDSNWVIYLFDATTPGTFQTVQVADGSINSCGIATGSAFGELTIKTAPKPKTAFSYVPFCGTSSQPAIPETGFLGGGVFSFNPEPGDGATVDSLNGQISGAVNGSSYTVEYTVQGPFCEASSKTSITVRTSDIVDFSYDSFCPNSNSFNPLPDTGFAFGGTYSFSTAPSGSASIVSSTGVISGSDPLTTYFVQYISPAGACQDTGFANVTTLDTPRITGITDSSLCNQSVGAINISVSNGLFPYTYLWSNDSTTQNISGLLAGNYTVAVTDSNSCSSDTSFTVANQNQPTINLDNQEDATCGNNNGSLTISVSGGVGPFSYLWSPSGDTTNTITQLRGDSTYTVEVNDLGTTCTVSQSYTILNQGAPIVSFTTINPTCGQDTGSVIVTILSGTAPFSYSWSNGDTTLSLLSKLAPGTYIDTVRDANNCQVIFSANLVFSNQFTAAATVTNPTCANPDSGSISISINNGGAFPFQFNWSPNTQTVSQNAIGLSAGTYQVTITDAVACSTTVSATLAPLNTLTLVTDSIGKATCGKEDGLINITVSGGSGNYLYEWKNDSTNLVVANTQDLDSLAIGTYSLSVKDLSDTTCVSTRSFTIEENLPILTLVPTPTICVGNTGTITLTISNGSGSYVFDWTSTDPGFSASTQNLDSLFAGTYFITVTDNGTACAASATQVVNLSNPPVISVVDTANTTCGLNNGLIDLSISSGTAPYSITWDAPGLSGQDQTNLAFGLYEITVVDAAGCEASRVFNIEQSFQPTSDLVSVNPSCGNDTGSVILTITNAVEPVTYNWSKDGNAIATTKDLDGLAGGVYTVFATDAEGCSIRDTATLIYPDRPIIDSTRIVKSQCASNTGSIDLFITAVNGIASILWTGPDSFESASQNISNLGVGVYTVVVTDSNTCTATTQVSVQNESAPNIVLTPVQPNCNEPNGSVSAAISGGAAPYIISWSDSPSTDTLRTGLADGIYTIFVTDSNSCIATDSVTLNNTGKPQLTANQTDATCGLLDGTISLVVTGGVSPYTYLWAPTGETTQNLDSLASGSYSVQVTDDGGCVISGNFIIGSRNSFELDKTTVDPSCGQNSGSITLSVNPPSPNYEFNWTGAGVNQNDQNQANLGAGVYKVVVTDTESGCVDSLTVTLENSNSFTVISDSTEITDASCGLPNGSIRIALSDPSATYSYVWCSGTTSVPEITGLSAGTCSVTITNTTTNCVVVDSFTVGSIAGSLLASTVTDVTCDSCNGKIELSISGGTIPFTILWSNGASDSLLTDLCEGSFSVTVTDGLGCISTLDSIQVNPGNPPLIALVSVDSTICGDTTGAITVSVSGGIEPYEYSWTDVDGFVDTTQNLSSLKEGLYTLIVTDASGCTGTLDVDVPSNRPQISFTLVPTSCGLTNGQISAVLNPVPSESVSYSWTGPDGFTSINDTISDLVAGTYILTATSGNCTTIDSAIVINSNAASATISLSPDTVCSGQFSTATISLEGIPPYTFKYSDGNAITTVTSFGGSTFTFSVNPTITTTYTLISLVSDSDPTCQGSFPSGPATLQVNPTPVAPIVTAEGPTSFCAAGSVVLTSNLQTGNTWNTGELTQSITADTTGIYYSIVTNQFGCSDTSNQVSVTLLPPVTAFAGNDTTICAGQSVQLNASGAASYIWSPSIYLTGTIISNPVATPLETITFIVTGTGACGVAVDSITFTVNQPVSADLGADRNVCAGDSLTLSVPAAVSGAFYTWNPSSAITGSTNGPSVLVNTANPSTITVVTTSSEGCIATDTVQINILTPPVAPVITADGPTTFCAGESVVLRVPNGNFIIWSNGLENFDAIEVTTSGTYYATFVGGNCPSTSDSIEVLVNPIPAATILPDGSTTVCEGSCVTLNAFQTTGLQWTLPGSGSSDLSSVSACSTGVYILNVTEAGCTGSDSVSVTVVPVPPVPTISLDGNITICPGEIVVLISSSASGNQWLKDGVDILGETNNSLTVDAPGAYSVSTSAINANNCSAVSTEVTISMKPLSPLAIDSQGDTLLCGGQDDSIVLTASSGFTTYIWNGVYSTTEQATVNGPGTYAVTGINSFGCATTDSITITQTIGFTIALVSPVYFDDYNISIKGESDGSINLTVNDGVEPFTYSWSNSSTNQDLVNVPAGKYVVVVMDINGCMVTDSITLKEPDDIKLPNGFTPNGDGYNDFYVIKGIQGYTNNKVQIFNRWGSLVYSKNAYLNDWSGVSNDGQILPDGTYFIVVDLNKEGKANVESFIDIRRTN